MDILSLTKSLSLMLEILQKSKQRTQKFINMQDISLGMKFDISKDEIKKEATKAMTFSSKLTIDLDSADNYASKLALFICQADDSMRNDLTCLLINALDSYVYWKNTAKELISDTQNVFENSQTCQFSVILTTSRRLEKAAETLCEILVNTINSLKFYYS